MVQNLCERIGVCGMNLKPEDLLFDTYPTYPTGGMVCGVVNQGIKIFHIPTSIGVIVDSERSQYRNREKALVMLEILVELEAE
jgi:protein subunit release factor A